LKFSASATPKMFMISENISSVDEGILLKPKKAFWDMAGANSNIATPEEMKKQLDNLREEDE
jgi:hypothetical protein